MSRKCRPKSTRSATKFHSRKLRHEPLEHRRVLTTMADIVFMVDESSSELDASTQEWLRYVVTGDFDPSDGNTVHASDTVSLAGQLGAAGINNIQYGLVGFGEDSVLPLFALAT